MINHLTDVDLLARISAKLASGVLSVTPPTAVFGGPSKGRKCYACDETIAAAEAEFEVEVDGVGDSTRFFHTRCYHLLAAARLHSDN